MWPCMKLRHIESTLHQIQAFRKPNVLLEQYVTPAHLASQMLHTIQSCYGDIQNKLVGDLGCGCGALTIGAASIGANFAIGFEIDQEALEIFAENVDELEVVNIDAVLVDALQIPARWHKRFDTIVMNPPFGTKHNAGIDVKFLQQAIQLANTAVYSLHKTSTRSHIQKVAKLCGVECEVIAELHYDLPQTYRFHKKKSVDIDVDFMRFNCENRE